MRRVITVLVLCCVLGACSSDHQAATAGVSAVAIPAQTLSLGGSLPLLSLGQAELARPDAPAWSGFAEHRIELTLAPPVHQSINLRYDPQTPAVPVHIAK